MEHIGYLAIFLGSLMEEEIAYVRVLSAYETVRTKSWNLSDQYVAPSGTLRNWKRTNEIEEGITPSVMQSS